MLYISISVLSVAVISLIIVFINKYLRRLRNYYNLHRHQIDKIKRVVETAAFAFALIILIPDFIRWFSDPFYQRIKSMRYLEILRVIFDVSLFFYFFIFGILRRVAPWRLDPMSEFYKTLLKIRSSKFEVRKLENFEIDSNIIALDLYAISGLAKEAWGEEKYYSTRRFELYRRWFQANPNIFSIIKKGDTPIGYLSVLPLNTTDHFNQRLSKDNIDKNSISQYPNESDYIYIENIYLDKNYQNDSDLVYWISYEIFKKIELFARNGNLNVYAVPYYKSFAEWLKENGFKPHATDNGKLKTISLPLDQLGELTEENIGTIKTWSCNDEKAEFFLKNLNSCIKTTAEERLKEGSIKDNITFVRDLNEFFQTSFCDIGDNALVKNFLGKTFRFYTHSVYKDKKETKVVRDHSLGISYITFHNVPNSKYIACKFYTGTKTHNKAYVYNGVCLFSKNYQDIFMIFHPKRTLAENKEWVPHGISGDASVIITGKILSPGENNFRCKNVNERLLSLNLTTYSQHFGSTVSKIGLLHIDGGKHKFIKPENLFSKLTLEPGDTELMKTIKLYLMRGTKVIIKNTDHMVINSKSDIDRWLSKSYNALKKSININYELYYYKNKNEREIVIGAAYLTFMENGVARLIRLYSGKGDQLIREQYFGEINIRYNENNKKFLYMKFIAMDHEEDKESSKNLNQHYPEIFVTLFWPQNEMEFDYTRGIIMGDRDVEDSDQSVISSNMCILCKPTLKWEKNINQNVDKKKKSGSLDFLYDEDRIERIDKLVLQKIIKNGISKKIKSLENVSDQDATILKMSSFHELEFNKEMCSYEF